MTDEATLLVVLNFNDKEVVYSVPADKFSKLDRAFGNFEETAVSGQKVTLRPYEGVVFAVV